MKKYKIGIDLDGVIWDLVTPWLKLYSEITGEIINPNYLSCYNLFSVVKHPETLDYILHHRDDLWEHVQLFDGVADSINKLLDNPKVDLQIVTATSHVEAMGKINRLFELLPRLSEKNITMTQRKDLLKLDFLIDDCIDNLIHSENTTFLFLISHPYNHEPLCQNSRTIWKTANLSETIFQIQKMLPLIDLIDDWNDMYALSDMKLDKLLN